MVLIHVQSMYQNQGMWHMQPRSFHRPVPSKNKKQGDNVNVHVMCDGALSRMCRLRVVLEVVIVSVEGKAGV